MTLESSHAEGQPTGAALAWAVVLALPSLAALALAWRWGWI